MTRLDEPRVCHRIGHILPTGDVTELAQHCWRAHLPLPSSRTYVHVYGFGNISDLCAWHGLCQHLLRTFYAHAHCTREPRVHASPPFLDYMPLNFVCMPAAAITSSRQLIAANCTPMGACALHACALRRNSCGDCHSSPAADPHDTSNPCASPACLTPSSSP